MIDAIGHSGNILLLIEFLVISSRFKEFSNFVWRVEKMPILGKECGSMDDAELVGI